MADTYAGLDGVVTFPAGQISVARWAVSLSSHGALKSWSGMFNIPPGHYIDPGGPYVAALRMANGQVLSGWILVTSVTMGSNAIRCEFQGTGAYSVGAGT